MMNQADQVQVTVSLPRNVFDRVSATVTTEQPLEQRLAALVTVGLETQLNLQEIWDQASRCYQDRLVQEDKLNQSPEEVLQELRDLREQIASELYP